MVFGVAVLAILRTVVGVASRGVGEDANIGRRLDVWLDSALEASRLHSVVSFGAVAEEGDSTFGPLDVDQGEHDGDPVETVAENRTNGSVVVPAEDGVEDLPSTVGTDSAGFGVTVSQMPNVAGDLVRSRAVAGLRNIASNGFGESLRLIAG